MTFVAKFKIKTQDTVKALFRLNIKPNKVSQLENDMHYQTDIEVAESIETHNQSEEAHSYIQERITTETQNRIDADNALDNKIDSINGALSDSITAVDNKYDSITGTLSDSIVAVDNKYDSITGTLSDSIVAVDNKYDSITSALDNKYDSITSALDNKYDSITSALSDSITAVDNKYDSITGTLSDSITAIDNKYDSITGSLDSKIDSIEGALSDSITAVDNKYDSITGALDDKIDSINGALSDSITAVDNKYDSITGSLFDSIVAVDNKYDSITGTLSDSITSVDNKYDSITGALDDKIDTHIADKTNPHEVTKTQVGLGNCDNTSDLNKPVSTAQQTALNGKVDKLVDKPIADTYTKVTINNEGLVVSGTTLQASDIPSLELTKISDVTSTATELNQLHESGILKSDFEKLHSTTASANELNILDGATLTTTELNYVDGVTSAIQTQIDNKQATITGAATTITSNDLTANRAIISDTNGKIVVSDITSTELGYLDNTTSNIQTQFNNITDLIPLQATSSNQLADKDFVNSSIGTNTANPIGTFSSISELNSYTGTVTNNDYAFVVNRVVEDNGGDWSTLADLENYDKTLLTNFDYAWVINGSNFDLYRFDIVNQIWDLRAQNIQKEGVTLNTAYNRYKASVTNNVVTWLYEYTLNNSSFTVTQWAAINSEITKDTKVTHTANTAIGDSITPVYIASNGVATALSYTLAKSVPVDAVFTDTTYSVFTGSDGTNAGTSGLVKQPSATDNTKFLKGDCTWATPTDTKNTAGSTDTSSKIFLVGATSQAANPQTYSHDTAFVDANGRLNSAAPASGANDTTVATTKWVKDQGFLTGITSSDVTTALGYTPQNSTTAVIHTASTVVGSATQPVYVASDGTATACTYTLEKSVPSDAVFTDTNTLMTQNVSTTNNTYPILLCPTANATTNQGDKTGIFASGVKVNPSTGTITATTFDGNATKDGSGNTITSYYMPVGIGVSTVNKMGTTTDYTNVVIRSETGDSFVTNFAVLSGRANLFANIDRDPAWTISCNKYDASIFVNGSYSHYTNAVDTSTFPTDPCIITFEKNGEIEKTDVLQLYFINHRGETYSAQKSIKIEVKYAEDNNWYVVRNFVDQNLGEFATGLFSNELKTTLGVSNNYIGIKGVRITISKWNNEYFTLSEIELRTSRGDRHASTSVGALSTRGGILWGEITPSKDNTYNCGSLSKKWANVYATNFKGTADVATKLGTTDVGTATQGIYLDDGVAKACTYTLAKSVPSNAVFTDTTYTNGTGITIGTGNAINHSNSVTAGTAGTSSATSGSTLSVPYVTYDAQGHVTASGTHTHTITGFSTTDTKNTAGSTDTSSKIFLVGATSQAANPQTYSHDTVFVNTDGTLNSVTPALTKNDTTVATTAFTNDLIDSKISDFADVDLSNLSETGDDRLHALKSYEDAGELLSDAEGLADVRKYAHSTFDKNKFVVTGTPNITDDGIASNYSSSNAVKANYQVGSLYNKSWTISEVFVYNTITSANPLFALSNEIAKGGVGLSAVNGVVFQGSFGESTAENTAISLNSFLSNATIGNKYKVTLDFNLITGTYTLSYKGLDDNISDTGTYIPATTNKQIRNVYLQSTYLINVCGGVGWTGNSCLIDLSSFKIYADGIPVFSGNKTGIDTIKPDNYTVVGTPTISADGVLSNCSSVNYLKIDNSVFSTIGSKTWKIEWTGHLATKTSYPYPYVLGNLHTDTNSFINVGHFNNTENWFFNVVVNDNGTPTLLSNVYISIPAEDYEKFYSCYVEFTGTKYIIGIQTASKTDTREIVSSNPIMPQSNDLDLGYSMSTGSIDLNSFKIYVNGDLVYQPRLKIPYTLSKTGSKVVDSVYRDRVNDMAEQFGYAPYYTLQEDIKTYYTVVGSPTISSDYIASGFSTSNYLSLPFNFNNATNVVIKGSYTFGNTLTNSQCVFGTQTTNNTVGLNIYAVTGSGTFGVVYNTTNNTAANLLLSTLPIVANTKYDYEIVINGTNITATVNGKSASASDFGTFTANLCVIGLARNITGSFTGSIDLNAFKIYIDNKLAYEAVINPNFTLPQGELYGLMNNSNKNTMRSTEFIVGTQTGTTGSWTGVTEDSSLYDGKNINYFLPYAGDGNATLNLTLSNGTTTGAKPVYLWATSYVTTQYIANSCINMTYNATKGAWFVNADRDANNYDRLLHSNNLYSLEALVDGGLACGTKDGYKKIASGVTFDIDYPIVRTGNTNASSNFTGYLAFPGLNLQVTKANWTGTNHCMVYLVGTLSGKTFTIDSSVFTTTVPTSADNKVYMPLGVLYSTYQIYFNPQRCLYAYKNGSFQQITGIALNETDTLATVLNRGNSASTDINFNNKDWFNAGTVLTAYSYSTSQTPNTQYWWYKITPPASSDRADRYFICLESDVNYPDKRGIFVLDISRYVTGSTDSISVSLNCLGMTANTTTHLINVAIDASGYVYVQCNVTWGSYMRFIRYNTTNETRTYDQVGKAAFGTVDGFTSLKMIQDTGCIRINNGAVSGTYYTSIASDNIICNNVLNINNEEASIRRQNANFLRQNSSGQTILSGATQTIYFRPNGDGSGTNQATLDVNGKFTATSFSGNLTGDVTGNATTATKLGTTDVGTATQGIYLDDGVAKACTYTVEKSVPSDAVFTDTNTLMTQDVSTTDSTYPILACPTANATSNQGAKTGIFGASVKLNPSTGTVVTNKVSVGAGVATMQYNSTTEAIEFVFT